MPAVSQRQRIAMAIAEHRPGELFKRNRDMLAMSHGQLHDFASTKGLGRVQEPRIPGLVRARGLGLQRNKMV